MRKESRNEDVLSSPAWNELEGWVRYKIQEFVQETLESEVSELLGRGKSERRRAVDEVKGYRNGYCKSRRLTMSSGTIRLRRPRVRGLEKRFESRILPLFARRTRQVGELLPQLYLHGLAERDFDLALRGLLGEGAPLSSSTVARLKAKWQTQYDEWKNRSLQGLKVVYLWVDGIYVKAGLEQEKAALLVVMAGLSDGSKEFVAITPGARESTASWAGVLRDLKKRGMNGPDLIAGDGHLGIWAGVREIYPEAKEQRCWNHRIVNVLDRIPKKHLPEAKELIKQIPYAPTQEEADQLKKDFRQWCRRHDCEKAADILDEDWDRMGTFYNFPKEHWKHIRTTNVIESPFATVRLRTNAAKRYKKSERASAVIWKTLLLAQTRFRKLDAPHLLEGLYRGDVYKDGVLLKEGRKRDVA